MSDDNNLRLGEGEEPLIGDIVDDGGRSTLISLGVPTHPPYASSTGIDYDSAREDVERFANPDIPVDPDALMMAERDMRGDYLGDDKNE